MNHYKEYRLVQKCLLQIEEKLGWGNAKEWHSEMFIELSEVIQKETQVLLSSTTLKRVWGKINYKSAPSISTLNTLSQFAGYDNWRDFKIKSEDSISENRKIKSNDNKVKIFGYASIIALFFISLFSVIGINNKDEAGFDVTKIIFASKPVTKGLPNSVVFDFDLNRVQSDSIYIQQFWDPTKIIKLEQGQTQATGQYYYPGYFRAKLMIDGNIIKEHDLFIKTDGWLATIDYEPIPKYIRDKSWSQHNLSFSNNVINEIKSSTQPLISTFHYINSLDSISGDNFTLNSSIKNVYREKWAVCQKTYVYIIGTKSALIIPFAISGCISEIEGLISEKTINGKTNDLSSLGVDFSEFKIINIKTENKHLTVSVDHKKVFSTQFENSIGDIVGLRYRFYGVGEVKNIELYSKPEQNSIFD